MNNIGCEWFNQGFILEVKKKNGSYRHPLFGPVIFPQYVTLCYFLLAISMSPMPKHYFFIYVWNPWTFLFVILFLLLHFKLFECYSTLIERLLSSFFLVNFLYLYHLVLQSCTLKWEIHFWQRLNVLTKECGHFYFKILAKEHYKMIGLLICFTQPYRFSWKNLFVCWKDFAYS